MNRFLARSPFLAVPILLCSTNSTLVAEPTPPVVVTQASPVQMVADTVGDPMVNLSYLNIDVRDLLKIIGEKTKMKIIIGDGVRGHVNMAISPMKLSHFLNAVGQATNFTWDRIGTDTIVVVPKPAMPYFMVPTAPSPAPRVAPPNRFSMPGLTPPQSPNPDWRSFEFNGSTIYAVPLQSPQLAAPVQISPIAPTFAAPATSGK